MEKFIGIFLGEGLVLAPSTLHVVTSQSHVDVHASKARLLGNLGGGEGVCAEFNKDDHYVGPASNRPPSSFSVAVDYHEVMCSFCVLEMRHMLNKFGWQKLRLNQTL